MRQKFAIAAATLFAALFISGSASANPLKGYWRMDAPLEGLQAVIEVYDCRDNKGMCGKMVAIAGPDRQHLNTELLRGFKPTRNGAYKGKLKLPEGGLPQLNATVEPMSADRISFKACFLGQCRKGTMSKLR